MDPMSEKPLLPQFIDHLLRRFDFPLQPLRPSVLVKNRKYVVLSATLIFILLCHSLIFGPLIYGSEVLKSSDLTDLSPVFNDTLGVWINLLATQLACSLTNLIVPTHLRPHFT